MSGATQAPKPRSLAGLAKAEDLCRRCDLYKYATQAVPGQGAATARLMLVGEQPGHDEDLAGRPFVGPAGRILDKALAEAGIDRRRAFVTNAVKHFKFEQRGKKRLHKKPNAFQIERCKWWNDIERALVRPKVIVALGATAARSLAGRPVTLTSVRGRLQDFEDGAKLMVTVHPSFLLRIPDSKDRAREFSRFVADLKICAVEL